MRVIISSSKRVAVGCLAALLVACSDTPTEATHEGLHPALRSGVSDASGASAALVKKVHAASARFHSTVQAGKAGYVEASPCVAHPTLGAMGFHWVSQGLVDPAFDPLRPEAILYAPTANGTLELVAVEYIVIDVGQPAPTFAGQPFDVGGAPIPVAHWTLHVWAHAHNPSGIFSPFNPAVSCP
jgi:hypothetical protein